MSEVERENMYDLSVGDDDMPLETLLTFQPAGSATLESTPQRLFKPRGLMLWGLDGYDVKASFIGTHLELVASWGVVPARWYSQAQTFEQVCEALAKGNEPGRGWGTWSAAYPGMVVRLEFDRAIPSAARALMWGHS